ncbi:MAG: 16S rRNA (guanine(527)-N(7))-methyltransferase RsmG [Candidatus Humimicrobiaceae bacterium]
MAEETIKKIDMLFKDLEIRVDKKIRIMMKDYVKLLVKGMEKVRLTGEKTEHGIIEKQLYDAIYPLKDIKIEENSNLLDLGSGGGLPGIPIKVVRPELKVTLVESNRKKANFLKETINILNLHDINVINDRVESIGQDLRHREKYDYVFCRAVAKIAVLAELSFPLLKIGGKAIFYKGPRGEEDFEDAKNALNICGGFLESIKKYNLKTGEERKLYVIEKIKVTPDRYPRKPGLPGKKPIH